MTLLFVCFAGFAWIGHAVWLTWFLNYSYSQPVPKIFLKQLRLFTGIVILAFPILPLYFNSIRPPLAAEQLTHVGDLALPYALTFSYLGFCFFMGAVLFPIITIDRLLKKNPKALVHESTRTLDLWQECGHKLVGDGKWQFLTGLPNNHVFRVDFTEMTLQLPRLPEAWNGLTILLLSDLHFHGTPSRLFFQRILDEIQKSPLPDVVALAGDYVDTDRHHEWIVPLLGQLKAKECAIAILGNHDDNHDPERVRQELAKAGYQVLSNRCVQQSIRGVTCSLAGHEGPWLPARVDLDTRSKELFTLWLSHSPDSIYKLAQAGADLVLCGHVHGGQIRLPIIGSIFVPSKFSRRFDMGVFEIGQTIMAVGRGISGKEPLRFRCHPQVLRITLQAPPKGSNV